jgi:hypothetical protein
MRDYRACILNIDDHRFIWVKDFFSSHQDHAAALSAAKLLTETLRCRYAELLHLREHVQWLESSWQDTAVRNTPPEPERPAKAETDHG